MQKVLLIQENGEALVKGWVMRIPFYANENPDLYRRFSYPERKVGKGEAALASESEESESEEEEKLKAEEPFPERRKWRSVATFLGWFRW
jgi:hypothetical protein